MRAPVIKSSVSRPLAKASDSPVNEKRQQLLAWPKCYFNNWWRKWNESTQKVITHRTCNWSCHLTASNCWLRSPNCPNFNYLCCEVCGFHFRPAIVSISQKGNAFPLLIFPASDVFRLIAFAVIYINIFAISTLLGGYCNNSYVRMHNYKSKPTDVFDHWSIIMKHTIFFSA